jgi:2-hydroxy-4-(methylsulfanyl)butanoate S-methyltransferase
MNPAAMPLDDVRDISKLAYGFMASKALFVALEIDIFGALAAGPKTLAELAAETGIAAARLRTLLTACVSVGLVSKSGERYSNAPASQEYLVRTAPRYFGDYYRFQIDRQIYPAFGRLSDALHGNRMQFFDRIQEGEEADYFSRAQHSGSLGPAAVMSRLVDLKGRGKLLDVAGGSGAFSITLCRRYPELTSVIMDFPAIEPVARRFVDEAKLEDRIHFLAGNALEAEWPADQHVILISYLLSAIGASAIPPLLARAFKALAPGGLLIVHDFMVEDEGTGPTSAALWLLMALLIDPDVELLAPGSLSQHIADAGFLDVRDQEVIPTITRMITANKSG